MNMRTVGGHVCLRAGERSQCREVFIGVDIAVTDCGVTLQGMIIRFVFSGDIIIVKMDLDFTRFFYFLSALIEF